jgi:6-phosphogluconolactonase/glucosamine-6-phosphate isomerase/deaminase
MHIHVLPPLDLARTSANALNSLFAKQHDKDFLFLSSGGSALTLLDYIDPHFFGPQSTIGVLDERYSTDTALNTMAQIENTLFYTHVKNTGAQFIDTKIQQDESIEACAFRFEKSLRDWVDRTHGTIITSVGIGPDAHTAGIMPYPENPELFNTMFNNPTQWVTAYDAQNKNPYPLRITTTLPFLRTIHSAVIFVSGENKKDALKKFISTDGSLAKSPCRIWREIKNVELYTDQPIV